MTPLRAHLEAVRSRLREEGLDGWLLFDFRGTNPFAARVVGLPREALLTRRWWAWVPVAGEPTVTAHAIEYGSFPDVGLPVGRYATRDDLATSLRATLGGARRVAMEYSPGGNIPYVSTVDGGTIDLVRSLGVEVASSADLLQLFLAWSDEQIGCHRRAAAALAEVKDAALALVRERLAAGAPLDEYGLQQHMVAELRARGMDIAHPPIVCFGRTSNDPHYVPAAEGSHPLAPGPVLMDLFCHVAGSDGGTADITWMAHVGEPSPGFEAAFAVVLAARDRGIELLQERLSAGVPIRGFEVDEAVRAVLVDAGHGAHLLHRTGHSLGTTQPHGDAAHFDAVETLDERRILPRLGFTIEPGVYLPDFGVRSEVNVLAWADRCEVTTVIQRELDVL